MFLSRAAALPIATTSPSMFYISLIFPIIGYLPQFLTSGLSSVKISCISDSDSNISGYFTVSAGFHNHQFLHTALLSFNFTKCLLIDGNGVLCSAPQIMILYHPSRTAHCRAIICHIGYHHRSRTNHCSTSYTFPLNYIASCSYFRALSNLNFP